MTQKYFDINQDLVKEINSISRATFYPFDHDFLWYGVDAAIHFVVMNSALHTNKEDMLNFINKYDLRRGRIYEANSHPYGFHASLKNISEDVFIPQQKFNNKPDRLILLFSRDYMNYSYIDKKIYTPKFVKSLTRNLIELTELHWTKDVFENKDILCKGIKFARDLLKITQQDFNHNSCFSNNSKLSNYDQKVIVDITNDLFDYYKEIMKQKS